MGGGPRQGPPQGRPMATSIPSTPVALPGALPHPFSAHCHQLHYGPITQGLTLLYAASIEPGTAEPPRQEQQHPARTPGCSSSSSSSHCPAPRQELPPPAVPSQVPSMKPLHLSARQGQAAQNYVHQDTAAMKKVSSSSGEKTLRAEHDLVRGRSRAWAGEWSWGREDERHWVNVCLCFTLCELVIAFLF